MNANKYDNPQSGVSLLELVIAVLVLSIAMVGAFRTLDQGIRVAGSDQERVLAALVARNYAAELTFPGANPQQEIFLAGRSWQIRDTRRSTSAGFVKVEISATPIGGGAGAVLVSFLPAGDLDP